MLAYRANEVPVGEDQREHIELMRDEAERFNARFGEVLVVPEATSPRSARGACDLQEPEQKMSTTGAGREGTVYVDEEPARSQEVQARGDRLGQRVVARGDKHGIANLIEISPSCAATRQRRSRRSSTAGLRRLQAAVAEEVVD